MIPSSSPSRTHGALFGLAAALLFGMSAPAAKALLPQSSPLALASLLYLGAAAALVLAKTLRPGSREKESGLSRSDVPSLLGVILSGGMLGPVLMLVGLERVSALSGSLLLNLEAPLTILIAVSIFGEHLGRREALAVAAISAGGLVLTEEAGVLSGSALGVAALVGACLCWAFDNNLTQRLSLRDPLSVVQVKTIGAGLGNLALAVVLGAPLPTVGVAILALVLGSLSYGLSIVLDTYALRLVGAAREAAYFATAPFFGALLAVAFLGENLRPHHLVAASLMGFGVWMLLREKHEHLHAHEGLEHEHLHVHDEHHGHEHTDGQGSSEPHAHAHSHEGLRHAHPHVSDAHHRHRH